MKPVEDDDASARFRFTPAWIALIISVLLVFWQVAVASGRVAENTRRIELLEVADRQRGDTLSQINARTARIEATLEHMRGVYRPLSEPLPPRPDQP